MQSKPWYTSKTIIANIMTALIAVALLAAQSPSLQAYSEWLLLAQGILNIVLRVITTTGIEGGPR